MSMMHMDPVQPDSTHGPACTKCAGRTRLTGIEPHPTRPHTDLRTFECVICNAVQAKVMSVAN